MNSRGWATPSPNSYVTVREGHTVTSRGIEDRRLSPRIPTPLRRHKQRYKGVGVVVMGCPCDAIGDTADTTKSIQCFIGASIANFKAYSLAPFFGLHKLLRSPSRRKRFTDDEQKLSSTSLWAARFIISQNCMGSEMDETRFTDEEERFLNARARLYWAKERLAKAERDAADWRNVTATDRERLQKLKVQSSPRSCWSLWNCLSTSSSATSS
jgi:hypothetical protein